MALKHRICYLPSHIGAKLTQRRTKQYKQRFKMWGWHKNLPQEYAQWMVHKAKRRFEEEAKDTAFYFGEMPITKERAVASVRRRKGPEKMPEMMSKSFD